MIKPDQDIIACAQVADSSQCDKVNNVLMAARVDLAELQSKFPDGIAVEANFWKKFAETNSKTIYLVHNQGIIPFEHTMHADITRIV